MTNNAPVTISIGSFKTKDANTFLKNEGLNVAFILRAMLFSMPVQVAALVSIGVKPSEIVTLEGLFLLGTAVSQMLGAYINDAISARAAFGVGKAIAGITCLFIALLGTPEHLGMLFLVWGAGVGIYDGSDFLAARNDQQAWSDTFRNVEKFGFYGSIFSFIVGGLLFSSLGFKALFIANALAALLIPVLLFVTKSQCAKPETQAKKIFPHQWLSNFADFPLLSTLSYALATVALKAGMIEVQHVLQKSGIPIHWNGWVFVGFTFLALVLVKLKVNLLKPLLVLSLLASALALGLRINAILLGIGIISLTLLLRVMHKIVFFSEVAEKSNQNLLGRDTSLGQVLAGVILMAGAHYFKEASLSILLIGTFGAVIALRINQTNWSLKWKQ